MPDLGERRNPLRGRRWGHVRTTAAIGALCGVLARVSPSLADARTEARRHFRRGMELIAQSRFEEGVRELKTANQILPHPNVVYNIARGYYAEGRYSDALAYFEEYVEVVPDQDPEILELIAEARSQVQAGRAPVPAPGEPSGVPGAGETQSEGESADKPLAHGEQLVDGAGDVPGTSPGSATGGPFAHAEPARVSMSKFVPTPENIYDEKVVSASRYEQSPLDAPNSTTNITRQDIRLTGITNVAELLRRVAGVQVMTTSPSESNVGIRGLNQRISPRILLLINGRSSYLDALGTIFWNQLPISVEDIERIEVIRGPASALYGANGFSGIVNIITRAPGEEGAGTEMAVGFGTGDQMRGYAGSAVAKGPFALRVSAGYQQADRYSFQTSPKRVDVIFPYSRPEVGLQTWNARAHATYKLSRDANLYAEGGTNYALRYTILGSSTFNDMYVRGPSSYVMSGVQKGWVGLRFFWNGMGFKGADVSPYPTPQNGHWNTYDVEGSFAPTFSTWSVEHKLTVGGGYRRKFVEWNALGNEPFTENHYQAFVQDAIRISKVVSIVGGTRMDKHPLIKDPVWSPRGAVVFRVAEQQALRMSASTAFRTFSFAESYVASPQRTPVSAVGVLGLGSEELASASGTGRLSPERILSVEAGYQNAESDYFQVELAGYFNRARDLITLSDTAFAFTLSDYADPAASNQARYDRINNRFQFGNSGYTNDPARYDVFGGELSTRVYPVDGVDLYANYAVNRTYRVEGDQRALDRRTSLHQVNAGFQVRATFGLDLAADLHYASRQAWAEQVTAGDAVVTREFGLPAYFMLNARVGYRLLRDRLQLGVVGYNLTPARRQHPFAGRIAQRVMGTVSIQF